jgi:hypothetical protein
MMRRGLVAGFVLAMGLVSCGGDSGTTPQAGGSTPSTAASFPVISGWAHGRSVDYLLQEISDPDVAKLMREKTGFDVQVVPALANVPRKALADLYLFMNGISGPNPFGFQRNVIDSVPGEPGYSPLWLHTFVKWNDTSKARELKSEEEILAADKAGEVSLEASKLVINCPVLPSGKTNFPIVTGWVDGKSVDYTLQEISDPMVTKLMTNKTQFPLTTVASLAEVPQVANLYLFMNGISGPNPFGFQRNVIDSVPGEPGYSPLWLHTFVKWVDPSKARELKSDTEIQAAAKAGDVTLEASKLVINCPVIPGTVRAGS